MERRDKTNGDEENGSATVKAREEAIAEGAMVAVGSVGYWDMVDRIGLLIKSGKEAKGKAGGA